MIIVNPLTYQVLRIDDTKLTADQNELLQKISRLTKRINKLQAKQNLCFFKLEESLKMRFVDILKNVTI